MSFDRSKLLLSFAFIGFLVGTAGYFFFDWIITNSGSALIPIPVFAPWFMSGIAGSLLAIVAVYIAAKFTADR